MEMDDKDHCYACDKQFQMFEVVHTLNKKLLCFDDMLWNKIDNLSPDQMRELHLQWKDEMRDCIKNVIKDMK